MTTFNDREKGFENKYRHDEELAFKANARRNKLLGQWAADKLGKAGADAEQYAKDVVMSDFEKDGDQDVVDKLLRDFAAKNVAMTAEQIRAEMARLLPIARSQVGMTE